MMGGSHSGGAEHAPLQGDGPHPVADDPERIDLSYLLENTPVILLRIDRDGVVVRAEGAGLRSLCLAPDELVGERMADFASTTDARNVRSQALRGAPFATLIELRDRKLSAHLRPVMDADGDYDGVTLIAWDVTREQQAEVALRKSRDELHVILASIDEAITAQRPDGTLVFANETAAASVGVANERLLLAMPPEQLRATWDLLDRCGQPLGPVDHPDRAARTGQRAPASMIRVRHRTTRLERWSMVRDTPIKDAAGNTELTITVWWDVTEAQRTQQLLRAEIEMLRVLSAPRSREELGPLLETISRNVCWDASVMWLAQDNGELVTVASRYPPDSTAPPELDEAAAHVQHTNDPLWLTVTDGHLTPNMFQTLCVVPLSSRERARGVLALMSRHDFAKQPDFQQGLNHLGRIIGGYIDRQRTERQLKHELTARRIAEQNSSRATLLADVSRTITASFHDQSMLLEVAKLLTGAAADWVVVDIYDPGATVQRLAIVHREGRFASDADELKSFAPRRDVRTPLNEALRLGTPQLVSRIHESEAPSALAWQSPSGSTAPRARALTAQLGLGSFVALPLVGRQGVLGVLTCVRSRGAGPYSPADVTFLEDVTRQAAVGMESARLLDSTQQALRARDEFLSIASHELRTPVTSLQLALQALERSITAAGTFDSFEAMLVTTARRQLSRLAKLLSDLLDVTRIRAGRLVLEPHPLELSALVRDVAGQLQSDYEKSGSRLALKFEGEVWGSWDPARMEQVVVNLLSNAAKYGASRPVSVSVTRRDNTAVLQVQDQGIGIDLAAQAAVFDPFVRAVSTRHYGGLGLGLFIVRRIVEAHGGHIRLQSEPGRGTTFTVELPGASPGPTRT